MTNLPEEETSAPRIYRGSCHCGAVEFEVELAPDFKANRCNCSICTKLSVTDSVIEPNELKVLRGEEQLSTYVWGSQISKRYFCRNCGVYCYAVGYLEDLGGDFVGVNLNALDGLDLSEHPIVYWDGRHDNWSAGPRSTPWPMAAPAT